METIILVGLHYIMYNACECVNKCPIHSVLTFVSQLESLFQVLNLRIYKRFAIQNAAETAEKKARKPRGKPSYDARGQL